jgi:hypothetical protein
MNVAPNMYDGIGLANLPDQVRSRGGPSTRRDYAVR